MARGTGPRATLRSQSAETSPSLPLFAPSWPGCSRLTGSKKRPSTTKNRFSLAYPRLYGHLIKTPFRLPVIGVVGVVKEGTVPRATSSARNVWLGIRGKIDLERAPARRTDWYGSPESTPSLRWRGRAQEFCHRLRKPIARPSLHDARIHPRQIDLVQACCTGNLVCGLGHIP